MNPDDFKEAWQSQSAQTRLTIDADLLLNELRRNQESFTATIFWRDFREIGVAVVLLPVWIFLGVKLSLPWTWYLAIPGLVWIAGFMLVDRIRHRRHAPEPGEPLRVHVQILLQQVEHQIWLLRNVFWWYLLPLAVPMVAFFAQSAWHSRRGAVWWAALFFATVVTAAAAAFAFVYWLNQAAVRSHLEPRRDELKSLLASLNEETPEAD